VKERKTIDFGQISTTKRKKLTEREDTTVSTWTRKRRRRDSPLSASSRLVRERTLQVNNEMIDD